MEIIAVTNGKMKEDDLIETIVQITPYVDQVILREKQKSFYEYLSFIFNLLQTGVDKSKLCVHTHAEIASVSEIPNLHLPEKGEPVEKVKHTYPELTVGVSVHSLQSAVQEEKNGADYVMFGHVYRTKSKEGQEPRGMDLFKKCCTSLYIPVIAIGGITPDRVEDLSASKAGGMAIMSGIFSASDPVYAVSRFQKEVLLYD